MAKLEKTKISYICQQCGKESPKWVGRCPECQAWNTMVETTVTRTAANKVTVRGEPARKLSGIELKNTDRMPLPLNELNRVLGGGLVAGSVALISGEPGIGKSTLLLQVANKLCAGRRLSRIYYYNVLQEPSQYPESYREQQEFLDFLRKTPYLEVRLGSMKITGVEKGIDVMIATDLLHFAWSGFYDVAILVSGDADFTYAVQAVKNIGKHVEVAYFESGTSKDLLDISDNRYLLDRNFFNSVWTIKHRPQRRRPRKNKGTPGVQAPSNPPNNTQSFTAEIQT